ncbi:hypothetical protein E4U57_002668 [Claviceps arundinis]|uniref:Uncharacterized protein n=1 Tax=Claviceps arundinis TaxID=1623583 RepID=A0ABQ7PK79_9HYPO|nr:hypothetical protein E4U57_002668 [Claviceps arundinis]
MALGTRTAARGSEAPEPQVNNDQQVPPLATTASTATTPTTPTTPTDDKMAALQRRLAMAELQKKIAQANSERRAFEQENASNLAPKAQGSAAPGASLTDPAETTDENLNPIVIKVQKLLVGVATDDINDVYTGKFEPWSLIRFHRSRTVKKKNYTTADYGPNPVVWASSFVNYMFVYGHLFHERHLTFDVLQAMNRFLEFMLNKSEAYQWKSCLEYAMRHHQSVKAECIHSPEAWLDHPRIRIYHDFNHFSALPPSQSTSQKRQRSNTNHACKNFNSAKGCTYRSYK